MGTAQIIYEKRIRNEDYRKKVSYCLSRLHDIKRLPLSNVISCFVGTTLNLFVILLFMKYAKKGTY